MNIALIQPDIRWEQPEANLKHYDSMIDSIHKGCDLILLPEMFTTGFTMRAEIFCLPNENHVVDWMKNHSYRLDAAIAGSLIVQEREGIYNRLYFVEPEGKISIYDKRHLFRMGGEGEHYRAGTEKLVVSFRGWRICPLICYDLRFPVWSRYHEDYDLLLYTANWPAVRTDVWNTLLKARAIENQTWVAGINRVGRDGEGIEYIGETQVIDPKGKIILKMGEREGIGYAELSLEELQNFRKKFPVWKDRDSFNLF